MRVRIHTHKRREHSGQYGLDGQGGCYKNLGLGDLFLCVWGLKNRFPENQNRFGKTGKSGLFNFLPLFVVPIWQKMDHAYEVKQKVFQIST